MGKTNLEIRNCNLEIRNYFSFFRAFVVLPMLVKIARSSVDSCISQERFSISPIWDSSKSSNQYCVSLASFSTIATLCVKSLRDSARFASL